MGGVAEQPELEEGRVWIVEAELEGSGVWAAELECRAGEFTGRVVVWAAECRAGESTGRFVVGNFGVWVVEDCRASGWVTVVDGSTELESVLIALNEPCPISHSAKYLMSKAADLYDSTLPTCFQKQDGESKR